MKEIKTAADMAYIANRLRTTVTGDFHFSYVERNFLYQLVVKEVRKVYAAEHPIIDNVDIEVKQ